jgi:hypothetical protein
MPIGGRPASAMAGLGSGVDPKEGEPKCIKASWDVCSKIVLK